MKAYFYDHQGFYVGIINRQQSPLEPGVWLMPASATTEMPPECAENQIQKWTGSQWIVIEKPSEEVPVNTLPELSPQEIINEEALYFLASTDWYIIREMDSGEPCPIEIKEQRAQARARIVK